MCKHNWKILSEVNTESKLEQMNKTNNEFRISFVGLREFTAKKFIQIIVCEKCGKLKRFVINI